MAGYVEDGAVRSLEARCTVEDVLFLLGVLSNAACVARVSEVAGAGSGEYRESQEAV